MIYQCSLLVARYSCLLRARSGGLQFGASMLDSSCMEMAAVTNTLSNITCRWFVLSGFALPNELVIGNSLGTDMLERQA